MNKPNFLKKIYRGRSLKLIKTSILSLIIIITITVPMHAKGSFDRKEIIHETIQGYIQNGDNQCKEGLYEDAAETYLMALKYQEFLPEKERAELQKKIEQTDKALIEQKKALEIFWSAQDSFKKNKLSEAKSMLESIQKNEFLSEIERTELLDMLNEIKTRTDLNSSGVTTNSTAKTVSSATKIQSSKPLQTAQPQNTTSESYKKHYADLYEQSKAYEKSGQYEKAREGYIQVLNSGTIDNKLMAEYIQSQITSLDKTIAANKSTFSAANPNMLSTIVSEPADNRIIQPQVMDSEPFAAAGQDETFLDLVVKERDLIRDYIKTLNTKTVIKVTNDINDGNFEQAKYEVQKTQIVINQYQAELGDTLFNNYQMQLNALNDHISSMEQTQTQQNEEIKNIQALQEQENIRKSREAEKKQRVKELLAGAQENKKLENYDAALGQLKKLLELDPHNQSALILKEEIEDRQYFHKQVELEKIMDKETSNLYIQGDEAKIPWSELVTFPTNWREMSKRITRKPERPFGIDEREEAVYRQLNEIVDLSDLDPFMTVDEVLNAIRNAVTPPLQIQPNWRDLGDLPSILPTTPADMGPLTNIKLKAALNVLINNLSTVDAPIGYVVSEGIVIIASQDNLPSNMVQRTYDIADLVGMPAQGGGGMMMGGGIMGGMMGGYGGGMMGGYGGGMMGGYGGDMMGGYGGGMMGGYGSSYGNTGYGGGYGNTGYGNTGYGNTGYGGGYGNTGYGNTGYGNTGYGNTGYNSGYGSSYGGYGGSSMMGGYGSSMMGGYGMGGMMGGMMGGGGGNTSGELVNLIQQLIAPDTWYDTSDEGEGTIYPYPQASPKKLTVTNTPEVHNQIEKLLESLRQSLGQQVAIEARYLVVTENWINDVGLDMDFSLNAGGKFGLMEFSQGHYTTATPDASTKVPGSLGGVNASMGIAGGYGSILDDLQVSFLVRATQARTDSKSLNAPRVTVLDGETASFQNQELVSYMLPPVRSTTVVQSGIGSPVTTSSVEPQVQTTQIMTPLSITPTIMHNKKYVLLNINFQFQDLIRIRSHVVDYLTEDGVDTFRTEVPETGQTMVSTRVSVPDGGTILLGGQTISSEVNKEAGVPILSKIPFINRLFMNRSKIKDQQMVLILVKPTIILQEEIEAEALGEMESLY